MLFTAVLCLSEIGVAAADPKKTQIVVEATCNPNGQSYPFLINEMSKTEQLTASTDVNVSKSSNVVVKQFTVEYFDEDGNRVGGDEYGNNKVLNGDLIQCSGITPEPIVLQVLGAVTAEYEFQAFITPRGKA